MNHYEVRETGVAYKGADKYKVWYAPEGSDPEEHSMLYDRGGVWVWPWTTNDEKLAQKLCAAMERRYLGLTYLTDCLQGASPVYDPARFAEYFKSALGTTISNREAADIAYVASERLSAMLQELSEELLTLRTTVPSDLVKEMESK